MNTLKALVPPLCKGSSSRAATASRRRTRGGTHGEPHGDRVCVVTCPLYRNQETIRVDDPTTRAAPVRPALVQDCPDSARVHDGSTRKWWVAGVLDQIVQQPTDEPALPSPEFQTVIKVLMDKADVMEHDPERAAALSELNAPAGLRTPSHADASR